MKKFYYLCLLMFPVMLVSAQTTSSKSLTPQSLGVKLPALDKSPMDISYFPADYPLMKTQNKTTQGAVARVVYSRPQRDNRIVFGELIEYGKVWRLGANEATEIEFFKDVTIAGKKVPKGRYTLYAIPTETRWTIIINKDTDSWGAFSYDEKKDLLRTDVDVITLTTPVEPFSMTFTKTEKGASLTIAWESVAAVLNIDVK